MEDQRCFQKFVLMVSSRAHIAENIVKWLDASDIVNCLRTSHDFRTLLFSALRWSQQLKNDVDRAATKLALTLGAPNTKLYGPLNLDLNKRRPSCRHPRDMFGFGLDGTFWLFRTLLFDNNCLYKSILNIYDLNRNTKVKTVSLKYENTSFDRPKVKILPDKKLLLQDEDRTLMFSKVQDGSSYEVMWVDPHSVGRSYSTISSTYEPFYGNDIIFDAVLVYSGDEDDKDDHGYYQLVFSFYCGEDRPHLPVGATRIECQEYYVELKEVNRKNRTH